MGKKYSIVKKDKIEFNGHTLYRIKALRNIDELTKKGDLGGYIETEENLSQEDDCFVFGNAKVYGESRLTGHAMATDNAVVKNIISDEAYFTGNSIVVGNGEFCLYGQVDFNGNAKVNFRIGSDYTFADGSSFGGDVIAFVEEGGLIDVSTGDVQNDLFNFNYEE